MNDIRAHLNDHYRYDYSETNGESWWSVIGNVNVWIYLGKVYVYTLTTAVEINSLDELKALEV